MVIKGKLFEVEDANFLLSGKIKMDIPKKIIAYTIVVTSAYEKEQH